MESEGRPIDVQFRGVTKRFGDVVAVDAIDLDVHQGEFLSLLGPSGCGKTTSLRMIAGFEEPSDGRHPDRRRAAIGLPPYKRNVNTVFQQYALFPHMSVLDNVAYGLKQRGRGARRSVAGRPLRRSRWCASTGTSQRKPHELSGGQQQRVALARALVLRAARAAARRAARRARPEAPQGDADRAQRIHNEVGLTFVFVTHDQEEAMAMSDRIAVMTQGRIEQLAAPRAMYDDPATSFVAGFIGDMNHVDGTLRELSDAGFVLDAGEGVVIRGERVIEPASVGSGARVGLRPEHITAHSEASGGVSATVVTKMYLGHQIQIVGRLANGAELIVRESRESCDPGLDTVDTGDAIELRWGPRAPLLLGESKSGV